MENKNRIIDRLDIFMQSVGLNDNKITTELGLSIGTIGKSRKEGRDLSSKNVELILNKFPYLNRVWLLTGEGEMLLSQDSKTEEKEEKEMQGVNKEDIDKLVARVDELVRIIGTIEQNRATELQQIERTQSLISRMLSVVENMTASLQHHAPLHCTSLHSDAE